MSKSIKTFTAKAFGPGKSEKNSGKFFLLLTSEGLKADPQTKRMLFVEEAFFLWFPESPEDLVGTEFTAEYLTLHYKYKG